MELQETAVVESPSRRGRKKIADKSSWKRELEKKKRKYGTVLRLSSDFNFYDWKSTVKDVLKPPGTWHFQFNASKRFFLRRNQHVNITVKVEPYYVSETVNYGNICKRGKTYQNIEPTLMEVGVAVKPEKLNDVRKLLTKHFGQDWATYETLNYYRFLQEESGVEGNPNMTDTEETMMGEESDLRVWY